MKNKNATDGKSGLYEVIIPLLGGAGGDVLFDDCPLCLEMKRRMEAGELSSVPIQVEIDTELDEEATLH